MTPEQKQSARERAIKTWSAKRKTAFDIFVKANKKAEKEHHRALAEIEKTGCEE